MVYEWKINGLYPISANTVGEELNRIYEKKGKIDPQTVVDESRPLQAPLHKCFEWDDTVAAEEWRKQQARMMICHIVVSAETADDRRETVRAFISTTDDYQPLRIVMQKQELKQQMLENAMRELLSFQKKYNTLSSLKPIFDAIETLNNVQKKRSGRADIAQERI